ncbi:hypothetical protein HJC23_003457 [Cyclotella cryptica]|uniref:Uncharacterized protein n=1 Tax=Cyclotella cryptica TaxID=29204 RepID=A0ABD3QSS5_9STRA|eukprot:CCRYP_002607-RA/>CCRYP_002607-RA protein AED:0.09 eAED:0.09 QI:227/1/1/1/0/0/2/802/354
MKSATILPFALTMLQPHLIASEPSIKVVLKSRGSDTLQQPDQEQQDQHSERDLYSSETIAMDQVSDPCMTVPPIVETEYSAGDDDYAGTNKTLAPTANVRPRPTLMPTMEPTEVVISTLLPTEALVSTQNPTEAVVTPEPTVATVATPEPTLAAIVTSEPTPNPTPYPEDDGGLSDDAYITTKKPTKRPTRRPSPHPTGKPGYGYLPTSTYHPTYDNGDDWASGWMPTNPSVDDDAKPVQEDDDVDDWTGGFPIVTDDDNGHHNVESKAGKSSGKSHKSGKSGKGSKSGSSATDDSQGWGGSGVNGLSKVVSYASAEAVSSAQTIGGGHFGGRTGVVTGLVAIVLGVQVVLLRH